MTFLKSNPFRFKETLISFNIIWYLRFYCPWCVYFAFDLYTPQYLLLSNKHDTIVLSLISMCNNLMLFWVEVPSLGSMYVKSWTDLILIQDVCNFFWRYYVMTYMLFIRTEFDNNLYLDVNNFSLEIVYRWLVCTGVCLERKMDSQLEHSGKKWIYNWKIQVRNGFTTGRFR